MTTAERNQLIDKCVAAVKRQANQIGMSEDGLFMWRGAVSACVCALNELRLPDETPQPPTEAHCPNCGEDMPTYCPDCAASALAPATTGAPKENIMNPVIANIASERQRQKHGEGWTEAHDDSHRDGELAEAAAAYILCRRDLWPFEAASWKPKDRRDNFIRAAALLVAEIERIDRQDDPASGPTGSTPAQTQANEGTRLEGAQGKPDPAGAPGDWPVPLRDSSSVPASDSLSAGAPPEADVKLNEYDKDEWRDVYRTFKPDATDEEFEDAWARFQAEKARRSQQ